MKRFCLVTTTLLLAFVFIMPGLSIAKQKPEFVLKAGHITVPTHLKHRILSYFAETVEERSNGRIKIKVYPNAKLGPAAQLVDGVRTGVIDVCQVNSPHLSLFIPEFGFFSLYYLFENIDHWNRTFSNDPRMMTRLKELVAKKNLGMRLLTMVTYGTRNMVTRKKPIKNVSDFKGLKVRIPPAKTETNLIKEYGATPAHISWGELYSALQTGVIDGCDSSLNGIVNKRFYEVAPFVSLTDHQFLSEPILINEKVYQSFPDDLKKVVNEAARDTTRFSIGASIVSNEQVILKIKKAPGVTLTYPDKASFIAKTKPFIEKTVKELGVEDISAIINENRIK